MKNRVIADNPLSQNLAKLLGYDPQDPKKILNAVRKIVPKMIYEEGIKITSTTILNWVDARVGDSTRSIKWPSLELLIPVSKILGVNYMDLFVPKEYIKFNDLQPIRRGLVKFLMDVDDSYLDELRSAAIGVTRQEINRVDEDNKNKQLKHNRLLNILGEKSGDDLN
jgi:hypothetical protein